MAKPTARLDLTRDELDAAMDGLIRVTVHFNELARHNPILETAYRNAEKRYSDLWGKLYDAKVVLPENEDA